MTKVTGIGGTGLIRPSNLNQSTEMLPAASLGDGDAICDVSVGSAIYRGGTTLVQPKPTGYNWGVMPRTLLSR